MYKCKLFLIFLSANLVFQLPVLGQVVINEVSCSNRNIIADNYGAYEDWIELYNTSASPVNLGGFHLSDKLSNTMKWTIPAGVTISANGRLMFYASGLDRQAGTYLHTNFKLTQTKYEYVILAGPFGNILDSIRLTPAQTNHSRGRTTDGALTWGVFKVPTPGTANTSSYTKYAEKPVVSLPAGFYSVSVIVALTTTEPSSSIRYTLSGMEPGITSTLYSGPITITTTSVLKAAVFSINPLVLQSFMEINTYFINVNHTLPVVSVADDSLDNLLNGNDALLPVGSIEYFGADKLLKTKAVGDFNKHGQDSWSNNQRSVDCIIRDQFGYNYALTYPIFSSSSRGEYQRIMLRAMGDDNYPDASGYTWGPGPAHIRDPYVHTLSVLGNFSMDERTYESAIVYVNGQYWGVYGIREKAHDADYTEYYYNQSETDLQYIMTWGSTWAEYGGAQALTDWQNLYDFIMGNDMAIPANYDTAIKYLNVKSLVDYVVTNSYVVCKDWLNYNTGWWRGLNPTGDHKKWGYILWDNDATFGHYYNYTGVPDETAQAQPCNVESGLSDPEGHITLLNKLRTNPVCDQYYISRYIDLFNTTFSCSYMNWLLDSLIAQIDPEMLQHIGRWGGTYNGWKNNVQNLKNFINDRCAAFAPGMNNCYNLTGPYPLKLNVAPAGVGNIQINSLTLTNFPWSGSYYNGIDINFKAIASDTNYIFDRWVLQTHTVTPADTAIDAVLNITTSDSIVAVFKLKYPVAVHEVSANKVGIAIYPNPFSNSALVKINSDLPIEKGILSVYNLLGERVKRMVFNNTKETTITREGLPSGIYMYRVTANGDDILGYGKIIVE